MNITRYLHIIILLFFLCNCQSPIPEDVALASPNLPEKIDFNFHIKPLLADRCYKCHGPDDNTREANFRLDDEASAFAKLQESGGHAFVKNSLRKSVAWQRIISENPEMQMPPPESNLSLSAKEKAIIAKWIEQGAAWKKHWAFLPPEKPKVEATDGNEIDYFIQKKQRELGLAPSAEADKERLIRRISFDLRGLPPNLQEIDNFLADESPGAFENLVNQFLNTDAHAERMAMEWLDVARFGDTHGLHLDPERYNYPWRDWVIKAFRQNMPYDEFITWQMAGDLLPNATREQKLATAFHRNHPTSSEGGIPDEEFRQKYVQDRTNTTATAFLGLTMECASCHDHKFDPISQKEYYQMSAFFNNLKELGMVSEFGTGKGVAKVHSSGPVLLLPDSTVDIQLQQLAKEIQAVESQLAMSESKVAATKSLIDAIKLETIQAPRPDRFYPFESIRDHEIKNSVIHRIQNRSPINQMVDNNPQSLACGNPKVVAGKFGKAMRLPKEMDLIFLKKAGTFEKHQAYSAGAWMYTEKEGTNQTIMGTSGELGSAWRGWDLFIDTLSRPSIKMVSILPHNYMQIIAETPVKKEEWQQVYFTYDGSGKASGLQLFLNGRKLKSFVEYDNLYGSIIHRWRRKSEDWEERPIMVGRSGRFHTGESGVFKGSIDHIKVFKTYLSPLDIAALYQAETNQRIPQNTLEDIYYVLHHLHHNDAKYKTLTVQLQKLQKQHLELISEVPEIMIMEDNPEPRATFVLNRGQYNAPLEEVFPATPQSVLAFPEHLEKNRLGLAKWFVDKKNPLTARVAVNRYWQMIFGRGLVDTPHDFGIQGSLPSHPELLDWLAIYFMESGWDVNDLLKKMVMSQTYRQSSVASEEHLSKDPNNVYLTRGSHYRLPAEMIRDNALVASGLLNTEIGGPSVKPYQPEGIWNFGGLAENRFQMDSGDQLYRRSMYTYLRRTSPHPAMTTFDAPDRLVCTMKRENTNTPLQALVLLNDPQFVEASRLLAERMQKEGGDDLNSQFAYAFRLVCGRQPNEIEMQLLQQQYDIAFAKYQNDPNAAEELLKVGEHSFDESLDKTKTAALAILANTVMNFDEAYMKR